jgi:tetratricopeptide (TPR) repeat protein
VKRSVIAVALGALSTVGALAVTSRTAFADPATADTLAGEAEALAKAGKYSEAAERFRDAWRNDPQRPALLCNVGIAYYKAKDLVRAHLLLGQCLEQSSLDPKVGDGVRKARASAEAVLRAGGHAPVRIVSDPSATSFAILELGNDEAFVGSRVVWLPFGTYHVRAHAEGYIDQTLTVSPTGPEAMALTVKLDRVRQDPMPVAAPAVVEHPRESPRAPTAPSRPSIAVPIAATVATAAVIGLAIVARAEAGTTADRAATALDPATYAGDKSATERWNTTFVVGTGVAAIGAVASAMLWHRALAAPSIEVSAVGVSVGYTARF